MIMGAMQLLANMKLWMEDSGVAAELESWLCGNQNFLC